MGNKAFESRQRLRASSPFLTGLISARGAHATPLEGSGFGMYCPAPEMDVEITLFYRLAAASLCRPTRSQCGCLKKGEI